nr:hypothetical protein CFP56_09750 [Quercus suber]
MSSTRDCINTNNQSTEEKSVSFDWGDQGLEGIEDMGSPWEGAVIYKRNPLISHVEYCTTLERLGLGEHSTKISKSRASVMGLRVTKAVKDYPDGTPVLISIDISRKKQKLRLDGIIKTVLTLGCNRCGEPAAECVFSNFSLLLTEEPIKEPEIITMGVIFGDGKAKTFSGSEEGEEDDEASIDLDDWLYFPPEEKEIDISKNIRDMLHVEITINAICDTRCKALVRLASLNRGFQVNEGFQGTSYSELGREGSVLQEDMCDHCKAYSEDVVHALWMCTCLNEVWDADTVWSFRNRAHWDDFQKLIQHMEEAGLDLDLFAMIVWLLWHWRNQVRLGL